MTLSRLNKLSSQPEQTEEVVEGKPYTVLTWHSALAAVKPGDFSLTVETPLTVRMRTAPQRRQCECREGLFDDSLFDDVFNDSFFQDFFGGTTEKQITVASEPDALKVLALPAEGRPAGFGGAGREVRGQQRTLRRQDRRRRPAHASFESDRHGEL